MRRKGVLTAVWLLATLGATLVAWAAVRQVTAEVSPSRTLPFPSGVALADGATEAVPPAATTTAPPATSEDDDGPVVVADPATTEAYNLTGGVVTVRYRGSTATLVSATPNSGFGVEINDGGPRRVDVRFRAEEHESRLVTRVRDGVPDPEREERSR